MTEDSPTDTSEMIGLAAEIVAAYVSNNSLPASELPELIGSVHQALLMRTVGETEAPKEELKPAVPIRKSVTTDHIVCLDDGKKFKSLKRHLRTTYGLTPDEYRAKWGLPSDYPMVAPSYAAARSELAKKMGLGRQAAARRKASAGRKAA